MFAELAQKITIDRVVGGLVVGTLAGLGLLLAKPLSEILSLFLSKIFPLISRQALLQTTAAMMLCTLILASLAIWLTVKLRSKLVPKYGIYWDRQGNAYCPVCQKLISQIVGVEAFGGGQWRALHCPACNQNHLATNERGRIICPTDARKLVVGH